MKDRKTITTDQNISSGFEVGRFSSVAVNGMVSGDVRIGRHSCAVISGDVRSRRSIDIGKHSAVLFGGNISADKINFGRHTEVKVNGDIDATNVDFMRLSNVKVSGNVETKYGCHVADLSRVSISGNVSPSSDDLQDKKEPRLNSIRSSSISDRVEAQKRRVVSTKDEDTEDEYDVVVKN